MDEIVRRLKVTAESGDVSALEVRLTSDAVRRLDDYSTFVDELIATKMVREPEKTSLSITMIEQNKIEAEATLAPWDDVVVFLHYLRPFILSEEPTNFYSICNLLYKAIDFAPIKRFIDAQRQLFSGAKMREKFQIRVDGHVINSDGILKDWLNAYEYHRDKDKRAKLESLQKAFPTEALKAVLVILLGDKSRAIQEIDSIVRFLNKKTLNGQLSLPSE